MSVELPQKLSETSEDELERDVHIEKYDYLYKIVLLGDSQSGKTCLLKRFLGDSFNDGEFTTIGIDFKSKIIEVNEKLIKLQIWDTAGKKKFESQSQLFLKGTQGVIYCFDLTSEESLRNVQNWIQKLNAILEESPSSRNLMKVLVGCKSDLNNEREVTPDKGQKHAIKMKALYHEVSAKTGQNVEKVFSSITSSILANWLNWSQQPLLFEKGNQPEEKSGERSDKRRSSFRTKSLRRALSLRRSRPQKQESQRRYSDSELLTAKKSDSKEPEKRKAKFSRKSCKIL